MLGSPHLLLYPFAVVTSPVSQTPFNLSDIAAFTNNSHIYSYWTLECCCLRPLISVAWGGGVYCHLSIIPTSVNHWCSPACPRPAGQIAGPVWVTTTSTSGLIDGLERLCCDVWNRGEIMNPPPSFHLLAAMSCMCHDEGIISF